MASLEQVSALMVEAASLDEDVAAVVRNGERNWVVRFEAVDVEVGCNAEGNRLVLVTTIGVPPPERRLAVLEAMMTYNFLVLDTGGVRMAMTGTDGEIVQMVDLGIDGLTARGLATILANMERKTLVWRGFVGAASADAAVALAAQETVTFQA